MPPSLNGNGWTPPGRHGVAATPPGSQMFAHMRSLNNNTLALWVLTVGPMASLCRDQMAPSPVCQVGFVVATREMPRGRSMGEVWEVGEEKECGRSMLPARKRVNKHTFQLPSLLHIHPFSFSVKLCSFLYTGHFINVRMHLIWNNSTLSRIKLLCTPNITWIHVQLNFPPNTFTHWGVLRTLASPLNGPCGGFSLVVEACVFFSASLPALASWDPLCVKCERWLIFVLPPLWELKTQLIHCDPSLIPTRSTQSLHFLPSFFFFLPQIPHTDRHSCWSGGSPKARTI